jgi:hypothetical protein
VSVELLGSHPQNAAEVIRKWLLPLGGAGTARMPGDGLPFRLITVFPGPEDPTLGLAAPIVQVDTLCDKKLGYGAAAAEDANTHDRMLLLARYCDAGSITLADGTLAALDYVNVVESPHLETFEDVMILRSVARYCIGQSYVASASTA